MCHDTERCCKIYRKTDSWLEKSQGIWLIFMRAVENLKICILMGYFCQKYAMFELK